jgi:hypothetical protein
MCVKRFFGGVLFLIALLSLHGEVFAVVTGTINPDDDDSYFAEILRDESQINFGYFTEPGIDEYNVTITETELTGYLWSENYGWISLNCSNGDNSCADADFKVTNTIIDVPSTIQDMLSQLGGYAWGERIGWINFGPFDYGDAEDIRVLIEDGELFGYAWGQNVGWIKFDCASADSCVRTDWGTQCNDGVDNDSDGNADYPLDTTCNSKSGSSESTPACSDGADNDGDLLTDFPNDIGCASLTSTKENPECDDDIDNDSDGLTDYPADTSCAVSSGSTETGRGDGDLVAETGGGGGGGFDGDIPDGVTPVVNPIDFGFDEEGPGEDDGGTEDPGGVPDTTPSDTGDDGSSPTDNGDDIEAPAPIEEDGGFDLPSLDFLPDGIQKVTDRIIGSVNNSLSTNLGRGLSTLVTSAGAAIGVAVIAPTLITVFNISEIALIPFRIGSLILSAFGVRRRSWGVVYDSITKQPLDPAYVSLMDTHNNEVTNAITDLDGRYGFIVKKGIYKLTANKANYTFPSVKLFGATEDEFYKDLYLGGEIVVENDGDIIDRNIPMDPVGEDWNETAKRERKIMRFYSARRLFMHRASRIFFYIGFLLSISAVFIIEKPYTFAIVAFYLLMFLLRRVGIKEKVKGVIFEKGTGYGIPFAVVRVFSEKTNTQIKNCVADVNGKYLCLVGNGRYYIKIEKKNDDGTYTPVYTSPAMDVKKGVINRSFEL